MYLKKTDYNHLLKINQNMNSFLLLKIKKNISTLNLPIHLGLFTFAFLVLLSFNLNSQPYKNSQKSIIIDKGKFTPLQILRGDTVNVDTTRNMSGFEPGGIKGNISVIQDSNYSRALRIKVPLATRFNNDIRLMTANRAYSTASSNEPNSRIKKNLDLPSEFFLPSPQEIANYQLNMMMSQDAPFIHSYQPFGLKVPMSAIGQLLGLVEDVSPVIQYDLEWRSEVQIVIYSLSASVVATIYHGFQSPDSYKFTWNGRDDFGKKLPPGDYIGEVRIGKTKYIRKRIYIPR